MEPLKTADCHPSERRETTSILKKNRLHMERHKIEMILSLSAGIVFGCVTQAIYGSREEWNGIAEAYCAGVGKAFAAIAPVSVGFIVLLFLFAQSELSRMLIAPAAALRGMGIGALLCGTLQAASLRELCFASLVLLPYGVTSCVIAVYAGEYALGFRESISGWNEGLSDKLVIHAIKMTTFYLLLSACSCAVFAVSCHWFGKALI